MNVVLNIGLNDRNWKKQRVPTDRAINLVGQYIKNCTITVTVGFYKGMRENSLKVEIYDVDAYRAIHFAEHFAMVFNQECVALTADEKTLFVPCYVTTKEYTDMLETLGEDVA